MAEPNTIDVTIRLKDAFSEGLNEIRKQMGSLRETTTSLQGGFASLGNQGQQMTSGANGIPAWAGQTQEALNALVNTSLVDLDKAFQLNQETLSQYYAERRRQVQETADVEANIRASDQPEDLSASLFAMKERHAEELRSLLELGIARTELLQSQTDTELDIKKKQKEGEQDLDRERLTWSGSFSKSLSNTMGELYKSGLAQSSSVFRVYQALAIAETTINTYKAAQAAYASGVSFGGPAGLVLGAVMAAAAVASGMARVATIRNTQPKGYAFGGLINGSDQGERADNVLIRATPGEYMLDRPAVRHYGVPVLDSLRQRKIPRQVLEAFASPSLPPQSDARRTAYAFGGEIGTGSLQPLLRQDQSQENVTIVNVMDVQRELERTLSSVRGRRLLINVLGEEGLMSR